MAARILVLVLATYLFVARVAAAGPYTTGIGQAPISLFPDGLFPDFSGPLWLGGAYGAGVGTASSGAVVRFGLAMVKFDEVETLANPRGMAALDVLVHLDDAPYVTLGLAVHRGFGRVLLGGCAAIAIRETPASGDSDYALVVAPELSYPLRWRAHPRVTPAAVLFARIDVPLAGRGSFDDKLVGGIALAMW